MKIEEITKILKELEISTKKDYKKEEYEEEIKILSRKLYDCDKRAKRFIENMQNEHQKEQRLMAGALYELGNIISQFCENEKNIGVSHEILTNLTDRVEDVTKGVTIISNNH